MKTICRRIAALLLVPFVILLDASAQAQAPENETDSLYLGSRVMLATSEPFQLTLRANIQDFAWSPDGKRIAFIASRKANATAAVLSVIDAATGHIHICDQEVALGIGGIAKHGSSYFQGPVAWSADGKFISYLAVTKSPRAEPASCALKIVSLSDASFRSATRLGPQDGLEQVPSISQVDWTPQGNLLAYETETSDGKRHVIVYDPQQKQERDFFTHTAQVLLFGWADKTHFVVTVRIRPKPVLLLVDARTGQQTRILHLPTIAILGRCSLSAGGAGKIFLVPFGPGSPDDAGAENMRACVEDVKDGGGQVHGGSGRLWVAAIKGAQIDNPPSPLPMLLIDSFRFSSQNDRINGTASAAVSRPGASNIARIAYLISGDLYLCTMTARLATAHEIAGANGHLTCPEERRLAQDDAAKLGTAIAQYTQDYDGMYPPAEIFHDAVYPYVQNEHLFHVDGSLFRFLLDGNSVKSIPDRSTTEVGEFLLPCGRVILYADGHVEALDKDGKPVAL